MSNKPKHSYNLSNRVENSHSEGVWAVSWPTSGDIITGSLDGTTKIWDTSGNNVSLKFTSNKHNLGVNSIASTQDGSITIVCHQDSVIKFYDVINKTEVKELNPGLLEAWSICLSPGDDVLASGNRNGAINIWSMQDDNEKVATLETNNKFILSTCFNSDGKLASAGIDGIANLFDLNTQQIIHKLEAHALPIRSTKFSPDGSLIYTASEDRHVSIYDIKSGQLINSFSHAGKALSVDTSTDSRHFLVGSSDHNVYLWDLGMQKCISKYKSHTELVWGVCYDKSSNSSRFVSVGDDSLIQLYE